MIQVTEQAFTFSERDGSDNRLEMVPGGVVILGAGYNRESLAPVLGQHLAKVREPSPGPFQFLRQGVALIELSETGEVSYPNPEYARNTELRAFFARAMQTYMVVKDRPEGSAVH